MRKRLLRNAMEIAKYIWPNIIARCKKGYEEHGDCWKETYGAIAAIAGCNDSQFAVIDMVRKAEAYMQSVNKGEPDLVQLEDLIVYAILETGRQLNRREA